MTDLDVIVNKNTIVSILAYSVHINMSFFWGWIVMFPSKYMSMA